MSKIILELPASTKMIKIRELLIELGLVFHKVETVGKDTLIIAEEKFVPRIVADLSAKVVGNE